MTVMECIEARTSIRKYEKKAIEEEKLDKVLEAGRLAPSASNRQTWKFVVVDDEKLIKKMAEACSNQKFIAEAPTVIVVCCDEHVMRCGQDAATIDVSIALSFMMLEATDQGIGTCWIGAFYEDKVRKCLKIPAEYAIIAVTPIGYPAAASKDHLRKNIDEVVVRNQFK